MSELISIVTAAFHEAPVTIIPSLFIMVLICYLSYKIYQEFKKVYFKINTDISAINLRISNAENTLAKCDERTLMLSQKLERIEKSLEQMNDTLIEVGTTLKIMREDKKAN